MQSTQEEFQLCWTRKLKEGVNPLLEIQGTQCSDFKAWFGPMKHFMDGISLASLAIVLTSWWQAECPQGFQIHSQSLSPDPIVGWDPCRREVTPDYKMWQKTIESTCLALQTLFCFWQQGCKLQAAVGPPAQIVLHSRSFQLRMEH